MKLTSMRKLYVEELKDLYNAEHQLVKALPKMAKAAHSPELKEAFETHLGETQGHIDRLEQIFRDLDQNPKGKTCYAMKGLVEEGREIMSDDGEPAVIDAALIGAAQKAEHYEIAGYGTARTFAMLVGDEGGARLLQETLDEEGATDKKLTGLAEAIVNPEAAAV